MVQEANSMLLENDVYFSVAGDHEQRGQGPDEEGTSDRTKRRSVCESTQQ